MSTYFGWEYLLLLVLAVIFILMLYRLRQRQFVASKGVLEGAKTQFEKNVEVAHQSIDVAERRIQIDREILAALQETNAFLKQLLAKLDKPT